MKNLNDVFGCLECGKVFRTVAAARRAQNSGCPKCGGSDVDLAPGVLPKKED